MQKTKTERISASTVSVFYYWHNRYLCYKITPVFLISAYDMTAVGHPPNISINPILVNRYAIYGPGALFFLSTFSFHLIYGIFCIISYSDYYVKLKKIEVIHFCGCIVLINMI